MPQIGDIGFISGRTLIDRSIEFFDQGNYNHVFIFLENDCLLESQYFVNTRIISNSYNPSELTVLRLNLTDEQKEKLIHTSFYYLEDKYDIKQIFGLLFHYLFKLNTDKTWNNPKLMICSELIVNVLHDIEYLSDSEYQSLLNTTPNLLFTYLNNRLTKSA